MAEVEERLGASGSLTTPSPTDPQLVTHQVPFRLITPEHLDADQPP